MRPDSMFDEERFTICTVSFGHARHLALNHDLLARLNPSEWDRADWLVAENAPGEQAHRMVEDPGFSMLPGSDERSKGASHHHASALNGLLRHVETRFLLVLDPDFYILRPNWLKEVEAHMRHEGLAFFGAPWHPRYTENYRYFPAVHCMFIDRKFVRLEDIDFCPILDRGQPGRAAGRIPLMHRFRQSWDTGTRVYERFAHRPSVLTECITPVYRPEEEFAAGSRNWRRRAVEFFLPDALCYLPKRRGAYTGVGFHERKLIPAPLPRLWEESIWRDAPFGLHVRGSFDSKSRNADDELGLLSQTLDMLTAA
ncbi:MAG: glycosyltransferase family 2 protein [Betaproteobacteria bacterium]